MAHLTNRPKFRVDIKWTQNESEFRLTPRHHTHTCLGGENIEFQPTRISSNCRPMLCMTTKPSAIVLHFSDEEKKSKWLIWIEQSWRQSCAMVRFDPNEPFESRTLWRMLHWTNSSLQPKQAQCDRIECAVGNEISQLRNNINDTLVTIECA